jgi:coiled-coil domain-containing protein 115
VEENEEDQTRASDMMMPPASDARTPLEEPLGPSETEGEDVAREPRSAKNSYRSEDPLAWYGVLVPRSLRNAQTSFTAAVEECIPELVSVITEMRLVEEKVNLLRKELDSRE